MKVLLSPQHERQSTAYRRGVGGVSVAAVSSLPPIVGPRPGRRRGKTIDIASQQTRRSPFDNNNVTDTSARRRAIDNGFLNNNVDNIRVSRRRDRSRRARFVEPSTVIQNQDSDGDNDETDNDDDEDSDGGNDETDSDDDEELVEMPHLEPRGLMIQTIVKVKVIYHHLRLPRRRQLPTIITTPILPQSQVFQFVVWD